jgi:hypothetical protein
MDWLCGSRQGRTARQTSARAYAFADRDVHSQVLLHHIMTDLRISFRVRMSVIYNSRCPQHSLLISLDAKKKKKKRELGMTQEPKLAPFQVLLRSLSHLWSPQPYRPRAMAQCLCTLNLKPPLISLAGHMTQVQELESPPCHTQEGRPTRASD